MRDVPGSQYADDDPDAFEESEARDERYADYYEEEPADEWADDAAEPVNTRRQRPASPPPAPPASPGPARRGYACADVITALFLLMSVLVVLWTVLLIANPYTLLNPLPPPTLVPLLVLATPEPSSTPTITLTPEPPTATIASATPTDTPTATLTPTATVTNTPVVGGIVPAPPGSTTESAGGTPIPVVSTPRDPASQFRIRSVRYETYTGPEGCDWLSLVGIVYNAEGAQRGAADGVLTAQITGDSGLIDETCFTGQFCLNGAPSRYGEGSFEVFLGPRPRVAEYDVQLISGIGRPISERATVETRGSCAENVVIVEFQEN